jgi:hypothetical protein
MRLSGLAPGEYDIFATVYIESPTNLTTATGSAWLGTGSAAVTQTNQILNAVSRPWSSFTSNAVDFVSSSGQWNYLSSRVTINLGDYVILIASLPFTGGTQTAYEPIISTLQIVAIPEPSTLLLVGLGGIALLNGRRRVRRQ